MENHDFRQLIIKLREIKPTRDKEFVPQIFDHRLKIPLRGIYYSYGGKLKTNNH